MNFTRGLPRRGQGAGSGGATACARGYRGQLELDEHHVVTETHCEVEGSLTRQKVVYLKRNKTKIKFHGYKNEKLGQTYRFQMSCL